MLTEVQKTHQNLLVKVRQGKRTDHLAQISRKEVVKREIPVVLGVSLNVQHSELQPDAGTETSLFTNTQLNLMMKRKFQHLLQVALRRMMNARCSCRINRMTRRNSETPPSREQVCSEGKLGTYAWSHPDSISKSANSKRSNIR